jgi:uncharacterized membrane protein
MNTPRRLGSWLATTLAVGVLVHIGTLYALPRLVMRRTLRRMGAPNSMQFGTRPTALSRLVVRPSPDILYASCPFDLSSGALRVTASVPHSTYWSVSAFDSAGDNFLVRNEREVAGDSLEFLVPRRPRPCHPRTTQPSR